MKTSILAALVLFPFAAAAQGVPGGHFMENWDLNGDGVFTLAEAEERRGDVFSSFDANDDGTLDAEEYAMFDQARAQDHEAEGGHGEGSPMRFAEAGMTRDFNDADGNGLVTREEYVTKSADWLAMMDTSGDGSVTQADFGRGRGQGMGNGGQGKGKGHN